MIRLTERNGTIWRKNLIESDEYSIMNSRNRSYEIQKQILRVYL